MCLLVILAEFPCRFALLMFVLVERCGCLCLRGVDGWLGWWGSLQVASWCLAWGCGRFGCFGLNLGFDCGFRCVGLISL